MLGEAPSDPSTLPLRGGRAIALHPTGMGHPRSVRFGGAMFTPYTALTHVTVGPGGIRIGSLHGSFLFRTGDFVGNGGHRTLYASLRERIAALPDGPARLDRFAALDALARSGRGSPVTLALTGACVAAFFVSMFAPAYHEAGVFTALLVRLGETWRIVTANFLHASVPHLVLDGIGLAVLGGLAERALGSRATGVIVALSAIGAMIGCGLAGYSRALGSSGIVCGIVGALLWLEFRAPAELPVGWRIPRRLFVGVLAVEALLLLRLPHIAHAAHLGGLVAGFAGAAVVGPGRHTALASRGGLRFLNAAALAILLAAGVAWVRAVRAPDAEAIARRGAALLAMPGVEPGYLNDEAWRIAISPEPSPEALDIALKLAERAVRETSRTVPAVLDTLAELHFLRGEADQAIAIGEEAAALAPSEPYYREQLRRFHGERAADDRPEAPPEGAPPPIRRPPREDPSAPGPGIRV
jgi:rhomboid protease GluP